MWCIRAHTHKTSYQTRNAEIKARWASVGDFILCREFDLDFEIVDGIRLAVVPVPLPR